MRAIQPHRDTCTASQDGDQEGTGEAGTAQQREHQQGQGSNQPPHHLSQFGNHARHHPRPLV